MEFEKDPMNLWIYNSSRLHNETSYISQTSGNQIDTGSIETILQVSENNLLSTEYLLEHLQLLQLILNLTVRYDGRTFSFGDFCQKIHMPRMHYIDTNLKTHIENIMPCKIITALNCFWEGSKLFDHDSKISISNDDGVNYHSIKIDWKSFNIYNDFLISFKDTWFYQFFVSLFKEAGIDSGYINKPCIDVTDPHCPNKHQKNFDLEAIVNQGCYQIARNLYKYSKSIFLGKGNKGLQSFLLLRSSADVLSTMDIKDLRWTEQKIQLVINLWLNELRKTVIKYNTQRPYLQSFPYRNIKFQSQRIRKSSFYVFTNNSLNAALNQVTNDETLLPRYLISCGAVMLFVIILFLSSDNLVRSHCWLAISSTIIIVVTIVSGLGLTAAAGFTFSALTTQVVPFLMIGLGLDEVVILTMKYTRTMDIYQTKKGSHHPVAQTLFDSATMLMLFFAIKILIICTATLIPVPLMRIFCIQVLFITVLQTSVNVFLYPCLLYLDSVRRKNNRIDLLCCLLKRKFSSEDIENQSQSQYVPHQYDCAHKESDLMKSKVKFSTEFTTSPDSLIPNNVHQYCEINPIIVSPNNDKPVQKPYSRNGNKHNVLEEKVNKNKKHHCCWKYRYRLSRTFFHIIVLVPVQITVIFITILIIVMGLYSAINVDCGLILDSIFTRDSNEYNYIKYESQTFRMQTFDILTKEINYVVNQQAVQQLHDEITELPRIEMLENGKFWLSALISWLQTIQNDFDRDVKNHLILPNGTWFKNASKNGLLAMTLMVQDGEKINYQKLGKSRLVRAQRVDEKKFYLFLNVWRSVSVEFDTLPCILFPKMIPFNMDYFLPNDHRIEPSVIRMSGLNFYPENPLEFVFCKYFYKGKSQKDDLAFVKTVREITERFTNQGVQAIPLGNIFSLTEQYTKLRYQLLIVTVILAVGMFLISLLALNHFLASVLITLLLSSSLLSPMLFMNLYQIPLNATSGVMAIWSGGLGFRFSLFLIISYVEQYEIQSTNKTCNLTTIDGNQCNENCVNWRFSVQKNKQVHLKRAFKGVQCGKAAFSTFIGMAFIMMTDINFIRQHFLLLPFIGLIHSLLNYYCLAPIICFYFIRPSDKEVCLHPISKVSSSKHKPRSSNHPIANSSKFYRSHVPKNISKYGNNELSSNHGKLSIIPEESSSVLSSIKSTSSHNKPDIISDSLSDSSQSQENHPHYFNQNVESSLVIQYSLDGHTRSPKKNQIISPELAVKTSFKYRQPQDQNL